MKPVRFCILAWARTGSNWLAGMLDAHPRVSCFGELFHPDGVIRRFDSELGEETGLQRRERNFRDKHPRFYLEATMRTAQLLRPGARAIGFKLFPEHHGRAMDQVMGNLEWKIILLSRRDVVAQYTSLRIAQIDNTWVETGAVREKTSIAFDPADFRRFLDQIDRERATVLQRLGYREFLDLHYEDLAVDVDRAFRFIGIDPPADAAGKARTRRQNPADAYARFIDPSAARAGIESILASRATVGPATQN